MRIAIIATGSRGDVQPYIALGKGLVKDGHMVRIVTHTNFMELVSKHGLEFWPAAGNIQEIAQSQAMQERVEKGNFLSLMQQMAREAKRGAITLAEDGLAASQGMDLLIGGMGGVFTGIALAEKLNIPFLQAYLVPFTPTRAFPGALTPHIPAWLNIPSHYLVRQMIWQGFRSADRYAREKALSLPPTSFWGPYKSKSTQNLPVLYGISPSVVPPPPDWSERTYVTGYWFLDSEKDWTPPPQLADFLQDGSPPVYIGFGSMSNRNPQQITALILEALRLSGQRAILLSGWGGLRSADLPDTVLMINNVPHDWLFPHMAAVVHHGGAGTTAAGMRAGVPSVIVPFFGDQSYWGYKVAELGVGTMPLPRQKLSAERLAQAIQVATSDASIRQKAKNLGKRIMSENGISNAVNVIGHCLE